jgi:hypothetical protein
MSVGCRQCLGIDVAILVIVIFRVKLLTQIA